MSSSRSLRLASPTSTVALPSSSIFLWIAALSLQFASTPLSSSSFPVLVLRAVNIAPASFRWPASGISPASFSKSSSSSSSSSPGAVFVNCSPWLLASLFVVFVVTGCFDDGPCHVFLAAGCFDDGPCCVLIALFLPPDGRALLIVLVAGYVAAASTVCCFLHHVGDALPAAGRA